MLSSRGDLANGARGVLRRLVAQGLIAGAVLFAFPSFALSEEATQAPRNILPDAGAGTDSGTNSTDDQAPPAAEDQSSQAPEQPGLPPAPTLREDVPAVANPAPVQGPGGQGVEIGELTQVDAAAVGTLGVAQGGFSVDMWSGTDRHLIEILLPYVPAASTSATARDLTRRLLLTAASIPSAGPGAKPADVEESSVAMLKARVDNLLAAGDLESGAALLGRISQQVQDDSLARERADTALLTGNMQVACAQGRDAARSTNDPYWLKLLAYCRVLSGDAGGANLALDLLRDSGETDPLFQKLFEALPPGGKPPAKMRSGVIKSLANPAPLYLSMLRTINHEIPADAITNAAPLVLRMIATAANASADLRAEAAETAAAMGALPVADLVKAYGGEAFTDKEKSAAKTNAADQAAAQPIGLWYQLAASEPDPKTRAELLRTVWTVGQKFGAYDMVAKANLDATKGLAVSTELIDYAADIARALLIAGDRDQALAWYNMARGAAANQNIAAVRTVLEMWPLVQLGDTGRSQTWSADVVDLWWRSQQVVSGEDRVSKAGLLFAALDGLDYSITDTQWQRLLAPPLSTPGTNAPSLALMRDLATASKDRRVGETVMLALIALGKDPLRSASPGVLNVVVRALTTVKLEPEARALALEIAVARGF
jgi:hypothetical protein